MTTITLNTKTRKCVPDNQFLGYEGENQINNLVFKFEDEFFDGSAMLNVQRGDQKGYVTLEKLENTYELEVKSSLLSRVGDVKFQLSITNINGSVIKFDTFVMTVRDAMDTDAELPEEYPSWIEEANAKIAEMDKAIEDANKVSAKIETTENSAKVVVTDKNGTTEYELPTGGGVVQETDPIYSKDKPNIALKSEIPIKVSQLQNDSKFITKEDIPEPPKVPTKTSELVNDSGFATETFVKNEIANAQLGGEGGDIDLDGFATKDDLLTKVDKETGKSLIADTEIARLKDVKNYDDTEIKQDLNEINQTLNNKANKSDIPDITTKQDTLVSGTNIKTINGESILGSGNITIEGGSSITLDTEMSDISENAVQNKVIKTYVDGLVGNIDTLLINLDSGNGVQ